MMKQAPKHLEKATREWWLSTVRNWQLEPHHVRILTLAAECWDRAQAARVQIDAEGMTHRDRFGQPKPHPLLQVERDSRLAFSRLVRELRLDETEPDDERLPRPGEAPALYREG